MSKTGFAVDELAAVVCAAIRRVVDPFQVVLDALLSDATVRAQLDLEDVRSDHVQVRLPATSPAPASAMSLW